LTGFLNEATDIERKSEVERIIKAFKLNPLEVLNVAYNATAVEVTKAYRDLSLLVHPDKCPEFKDDAQKAFTILTAAKTELLEEQKRGVLNDIVIEARKKVVEAFEKELKKSKKKEISDLKIKDPLAVITPEMEAIPDVTKMAEFDELVKAQTKELLIDREWRTRQLLKMAAQEEGLAAKNKEEKDVQKKAKEQTDQEWEQNREKRVGSWRDFMHGKTKGGTKRLRAPRMPKLTAEDPNKSYIKRVKTGSGAIGARPGEKDEEDERSKP